MLLANKPKRFRFTSEELLVEKKKKKKWKKEENSLVEWQKPKWRSFRKLIRLHFLLLNFSQYIYYYRFRSISLIENFYFRK